MFVKGRMYMAQNGNSAFFIWLFELAIGYRVKKIKKWRWLKLQQTF